MDQRPPTLQRYVASGDHQAFRALVDEYQRMVYVTCQRILERCPAEVDDAVQETFLKLARAAPTIESNVGAWLHACARTTALNRLRAQRQRGRREVDIDQTGVAVANAPVDALEQGEELRLVEDCVGELPTSERELVLAYYYLGQTQQQIADRLGVSQVAIQKRLKGVLEVLRHRCLRRGVALAALALALENSSHAAMPPGLAGQLAAMPIPDPMAGVGAGAGAGVGGSGSAGSGVSTSTWLVGAGATAAVAVAITLLGPWGRVHASAPSTPVAAMTAPPIAARPAPRVPTVPVAPAGPTWPAAVSLDPAAWTCTLVHVEHGHPEPGSPSSTAAMHLKFDRAYVPGVAVCAMPHLSGDFAIECDVHTRSITCPFSSIWCEPVLVGRQPLLQPVQPDFFDVTRIFPVGSWRHLRFEFRRQGGDLHERVLVGGKQLIECTAPQAPACADRIAVRTVDGDVDITHLVVRPLTASSAAPLAF